MFCFISGLFLNSRLSDKTVKTFRLEALRMSVLVSDKSESELRLRLTTPGTGLLRQKLTKQKLRLNSAESNFAIDFDPETKARENDS